MEWLQEHWTDKFFLTKGWWQNVSYLARNVLKRGEKILNLSYDCRSMDRDFNPRPHKYRREVLRAPPMHRILSPRYDIFTVNHRIHRIRWLIYEQFNGKIRRAQYIWLGVFEKGKLVWTVARSVRLQLNEQIPSVAWSFICALFVCLMCDCLLRALFRSVTQIIQNKFHSYIMRMKYVSALCMNESSFLCASASDLKVTWNKSAVTNLFLLCVAIYCVWPYIVCGHIFVCGHILCVAIYCM
jgi:hypothetical protein